MRRQSHLMSLVEAITNVVVGFLLALLTQIVVFPFFGLTVSVADNVLIGSIFTTVSVLRSFVLRRLFEAARVRPTSVKPQCGFRRKRPDAPASSRTR
jgi:hypothetical protein